MISEHEDFNSAQLDAADKYLTRGYVFDSFYSNEKVVVLICEDRWIFLDPKVVAGTDYAVFARPCVAIDMKGRVLKTNVHAYDQALLKRRQP